MQHVTQSGVDCSRLRHVMSCDVFGGGGPRGAVAAFHFLGLSTTVTTFHTQIDVLPLRSLGFEILCDIGLLGATAGSVGIEGYRATFWRATLAARQHDIPHRRTFSSSQPFLAPPKYA